MLKGQTPTFRRDICHTYCSNGEKGERQERMKIGKGGVKGERIMTELEDQNHGPELRFWSVVHPKPAQKEQGAFN